MYIYIYTYICFCICLRACVYVYVCISIYMYHLWDICSCVCRSLELSTPACICLAAERRTDAYPTGGTYRCTCTYIYCVRVCACTQVNACVPAHSKYFSMCAYRCLRGGRNSAACVRYGLSGSAASVCVWCCDMLHGGLRRFAGASQCCSLLSEARNTDSRIVWKSAVYSLPTEE